MDMFFERIGEEIKLNKGLPKNKQVASRPIEQPAPALEHNIETNK